MITFTLYKDNAGQYRWTLYAANNRKIADSAEGYINKADARAMIDKIKAEASTAQVVDRA